ncbi:MAG: CotH kinase family protein [Bacteroidia bacterium]|nr:CotH kinase family protein [Bacteroidia bacterium]
MKKANYPISLALFFSIAACLGMISTLNAQVVVNEYSASNLTSFTDNYGDYEDWVELYNPGTGSVSIGGYHLSDDPTQPMKWEIPAGTMIAGGGYQVFWASGRDEASGGNFHTNFKFAQTKSNKDWIVFADQMGNILWQDSLSITQLGHSNGRITNGNNSWAVFTNPTPGWSNNSSTPYTGYASKPTADSSSGFYSSAITVTVTKTQPNSVIRYTTNGYAVTASSPVLSQPLTITQTTVLKTRVFSNNGSILPSFEDYKTFFINENHTLPVVSIAGTNLDSLADGNTFYLPHGTLEYFNENGKRKAKGYGEFNHHGNDSWAYDQRGLDWITRDEMGYERHLKEQFFIQSPRKEFQRLILRPEGNDNYTGSNGGAHMRDMYSHRLAERSNMDLTVRRARKCVIYLNGNYWGVYSLREKVDDHDYTDYYFGQDKYHLQVIKTWGGTWAEYGGFNALNDWDNLHNFIINNNMAVPANWEHVDTLLDVKSVADYFLLNSYTVCADWLVWNTGWWRGLDTAGTHRKWGFMLWDLDNTFGHGTNYTGIPTQAATADPCFQDSLGGFSDPEGHAEMLQALRTNPDFDNYYVSRYADLLNTQFSCDSMLVVLDSIVALVDPEMSRHSLRWGGTYAGWMNNVNTLRNYIQTRCVHVQTGLNPCYNLSGPYDLAFNVDPPNSGSIQVNSLTVSNFPWHGNYYENLPISLEGVESNPQYIFDFWEVFNHTVTPNSSTKAVQLSITQADSVVAHFAFNPLATDPVIVSKPETQIMVYPNPFSESTHIQVEGDALASQVVVFDLLGKPVRQLSPTGSNHFELNREGLSNGIYWFRVLDDGGQILGTGKVVVER